MKVKSVKSYAKINIALCIKEKHEDGYHELDTIMVPIEYHDSLIISELQSASDHFVTIDDYADGIIKYNLVSSVINAMSEKYHFNQKFRVYIHKNIPMQAGLGGGSSNAAFAMKAVNQMLKLNITDDELISIAKPLGADIPFFIRNVPARCKGIGEKMEPISIKNDYYVLLVKPREGVSTKECFMYCDKAPYLKVDIDKVVKALEEGDDDKLADSIGNSMYEAANTIYPKIGEIVAYLKEKGLKIVGMSGSGSTVFALSQDKNVFKAIRNEIGDKWFCEITKIIK